MEAIGAGQFAFCALVLIAAFAVRGGAGFGAGAVAVPLLALALPVQVAVPVVSVLILVSSIGQSLANWRKVVWAEVLRVTPFTLVGVALGLYLLSQIEAKSLRVALGIFVILYAIYAFAAAGYTPTVARRWVNPLAATLGLGAGCIGALFGSASSPFYAIYLNVLRLEKDQFRITITTIVLFLNIFRLSGYVGLGFFHTAALIMLAAALPLMLLGAYLGDHIVRRLDQQKFGRFIAGVLFVSGAALLVK